MRMRLYDYWRSSAAYRLRIAFNLKQVDIDLEEVDLHPAVRAHLSEPYAGINPQRRVPALATETGLFNQSMAILEWIEETWADPPLLPRDPDMRLRSRAFAQTVACDIHPLNTPAVLGELRHRFGADQADLDAWYGHWICRGFGALETEISLSGGSFLFGDQPGFAEIALVPQMYNARRFKIDVSAFPKLVEIDAACQQLPAFRAAAPDAVRPS